MNTIFDKYVFKYSLCIIEDDDIVVNFNFIIFSLFRILVNKFFFSCINSQSNKSDPQVVINLLIDALSNFVVFKQNP